MAVAPVVLALSRSGEATAHRVAELLGAQVHGRATRVERADAFFANALDHARDLFAAGVPIVGVCASGILIRGVAPLLTDKTTEPPVVSVSDDGSVVVPLLGGHRGANRLARQIADGLGSAAAVTTAGDVALGVALDEPPLGWRLANPKDAQEAMAALLSGAKATVIAEGASFLDPLVETGRATKQEPATGALRRISAGAQPDGVALQGIGNSVLLDIHHTDGDPLRLSYRAQQVVIGVGCARGCDPKELSGLVHTFLRRATCEPSDVACIASIDLKADEPAILSLARELDVPLRLFDAATLDRIAAQVPNPSEVVLSEVGTRSVAEASALAGTRLAGTGLAGIGLAGIGAQGDLFIEKQKTKNATCAFALAPQPLTQLAGRARGQLSLVGIGPGQAVWRTPEASRLVAEADELVGYSLYIDLLGPLAAGKKRQDFPLGGEEARCRYALERAGEGRNVALICSGDAGIYAMGALVFELLDRGDLPDSARRVEVVSAPGVSALQAAAARAGAPLGHDFCAISLSDLLTPRDDILRRIKAAAEGDFVIAFYNPVSKRRRDLLEIARDTLLRHRPADTPVLLATSLGRPEEALRYRRLDALEVAEVDMLTVVLVGSSHSKLATLGEGPRMYTPRGYAKKMGEAAPSSEALGYQTPSSSEALGHKE